MPKIDNSILKKIIETYRALPIEASNTTLFINDIYQRIDQHRIKVINLIDEEERELEEYGSIAHESYCHAFYRMLGLPVVSPTLGEFYSPGYYAPNFNDYKKIRENVNRNYGPTHRLESKRELISATNMSVFLSKTDESFEYKIAMLKHPRSVLVMKETTNPFEIDNQIETIKDRPSKFATVQHILRPFRCNPLIATVDKVRVASKNLAAPFYISTVDENIEKYTKCYLEMVCKIRFSTISDKNTKTPAISNLVDALKIIEIGGQSAFQSVLNNQSVIEVYTLSVLMNNFIQACLDAVDKTKQYKNLAAKYDSTSDDLVLLSDEIDKLESQKLWYESIQAFIPNEISKINGNSVETSNADDGILTSPFLYMLNSPVRKINQLLSEKKQKQKKHMGEINNLSSEMFNITGEVYGIGALEIMALMIGFWSISQESLISMLDAPAFERLYNQHPTLRNELVLQRNSMPDKSSPKDIIEAIEEFDSIVYNLLSLADAIILYSYKDSRT